MTRAICVGDIHGCLDELDELIRLVEYRKGVDRLILLGDYMDKGPDPVGVVRRAQEVGAEAILGNHDEKHLRWRRHEDRRAADPKYKNPMKPWKEPMLSQNAGLSASDIDWLRSLPVMLRIDANAVAVHGGFEPGRPIDKQRPEKMLRCRYVDPGDGEMVGITSDVHVPPGTVLWAKMFAEPVHVFYGHHCLDLGEIRVDLCADDDGRFWMRAGLDAGAAYGGRLVAMITTPTTRGLRMPMYETVGVQLKETYAELWKGDDA